MGWRGDPPPGRPRVRTDQEADRASHADLQTRLGVLVALMDILRHSVPPSDPPFGARALSLSPGTGHAPYRSVAERSNLPTKCRWRAGSRVSSFSRTRHSA